MDRRRKEGLMASAHDKLDEALVTDALVYTRGNESRSAEILCVSRNTVRRVRARMRRLPKAEGYTYQTSPKGAPWVPQEIESSNH